MKKTYYERVTENQEYFPDMESLVFKKLCPIIGTRILAIPDFYDALLNTIDSQDGLMQFLSSIKTVGEAQFNTIMNITYQLYYFWVYQKTVYRISDEIVNALISTDVDDMNINNLLIPTPNLYLSFSNKFFTLQDYDTGIHPVYGLFLTNYEDEEYKYWRILVTADKNINSKHALDDSIFYYRLKLEKNKKISEGFNIDGDITKQAIDYNDIFKEQIESTFKFLCNVILYLNLSGQSKKYTRNNIPPRENIKNPKKLRRWDKEYSDYSKLHFYDIKDETLENIFKKENPGHGTITDMIRWKSAWIVRGHWHNYWVGKGRSETKLNWLKPYWKGEDKMEIKK